MKIRDLVAELQKHDGDMDVVLDAYRGFYFEEFTADNIQAALPGEKVWMLGGGEGKKDYFKKGVLKIVA